MLLVADGSPFVSLPHIVDGLADPRIWVYAELIGNKYKARDGSSWRPDYHGPTSTSLCILSRSYNARAQCKRHPGTAFLGYLHSPLRNAQWGLLLAGHLYNLTDQAIRACPASTKWVLVTNGDNLYSKDMFQTVMDVPGDADVIALDYYSRYQRATGPPCTRFAASEGAPPCKENR